MKNTLYNVLAWLAIAAFTATLVYSFVTFTMRMHPAEDCMEDEVWAPVEYGTYNSTEDAAGVNRVCVNIEELN